MSDFNLWTRSETPAFVAWSIRRVCPLRRRAARQNPLAVERHLRPVRVWSEAVAEGRIWRDVCLQETAPGKHSRGFPIAETLHRYGGTAAIQETCGNCQVNIPVPRPQRPESSAEPTAAGCYGWLPLPSWLLRQLRVDEIARATRQPLESLQGKLAVSGASLLRTHPPGHAVWLLNEWPATWLAPIAAVLQTLLELVPDADEVARLEPAAGESEFVRQSLQRLIAACNRAATGGYSLDCELLPPGRRVDRQWHWVDHCDRCKMPRTQRERSCETCGKTGGVQSGTKRAARGHRPFFPLAQFLSQAELTELVSARGRD